MVPLNSTAKDALSEQRIKTLTNAARISLLIDKAPRTGGSSPPHVSPIGRTSDRHNENAAPADRRPAKQPITAKPAPKAEQPAKQPDDTGRWNFTGWRSVNAAAEQRASFTNITLNDCRAVRFSMALRTAEKSQRQIVRQKLAERQSQYDDFVEQLSRLRIDSTERALDAVRRSALEKEERILAAARQLDDEARQAEEHRRRELEGHERRAKERSARLRRDEEMRTQFESIKSSKNLFIVVFEKLVKTLLLNQASLPNSVEHNVQQNAFLKRYETLLTQVNQGQISADVAGQLEALCDDMQQMQRRVDEEIADSEEKLTQLMKQQQQRQQQQEQQEQQQQEKQQLDEERQREQQQKQQERPVEPVPVVQQQPDTTDTAPVAQPAPAVAPTQGPSNAFVHPDRLAAYMAVMEFYEQYKLSVKELQADAGQKQFRFNCQKAINIPLNAISAISPQHLVDKFDKLTALLNGMPVQVGELTVCAGSHPLGVRFCSLLAAKKLVSQADSIISSDPKHAFPIAAIMVAVWQRFPDMGQLCLAYLYKESPYLAPYFIPHMAGQSVEAYTQLLGYRWSNGQIEPMEMYLKRQTGLVRLYAAIVVSDVRRANVGSAHPHGLQHGWTWLAHFMNLDPLPQICASLLYEFLVVAGSDLGRAYRRQFDKLLQTLHGPYMEQLKRIDVGGPRVRLEELLSRALQDGQIERHDGKLPPNFW